MVKPVITTRATKGSALTWTEGDNNLTNLRDATVSIKAGTAGTSVVSDLNGEITLVAGTNITLTGDNTAKTVTIDASSTPATTPAGANQQIQFNNNGSFGASSNLYYDGVSLKVTSGNIESLYSNGDEGGEFRLATASTNTTLAGGSIAIDINQNRLRFFETGGSNRGAYIDLSAAATGVGSDLLANSGGATVLDDLTDVVITGAATNDVLVYNGTNWVDQAASGLTVGTATVGSTVTLTSDNTTNATNYPLFVNAATGNLSPRTDTGFTYNPSTGALTSTSFSGSVSGAVSATTLSASSTVSGTGFTNYMASPPQIGSTTAAPWVRSTAFTRSGNQSVTAWTTSGLGFRSDSGTFTDTSSLAGTVAASYINSFQTPTFASTNLISITEAANLFLADPAAGTNSTLTNKYSLVAGGNIKLQTQKELHFSDSDSTNWVGFKAPATITTNKIWTLPSADATISGQALVSDAAGNLSWATVSSPSITDDTSSATTHYLILDDATSGEITPKTSSTKLTFIPSTGVLTATGFDGAFNGTVGATTANTGKFTSLEFKNPLEPVFALTYSATLSPDAANGSVQKVTLTGAVNISAFTNPTAGESITLILIQDATGSRTLTSTFKFAGGSKTLSTAANSIDIMTVYYDGTNYYASLAKGFA